MKALVLNTFGDTLFPTESSESLVSLLGECVYDDKMCVGYVVKRSVQGSRFEARVLQLKSRLTQMLVLFSMHRVFLSVDSFFATWRTKLAKLHSQSYAKLAPNQIHREINPSPGARDPIPPVRPTSNSIPARRVPRQSWLPTKATY